MSDALWDAHRNDQEEAMRAARMRIEALKGMVRLVNMAGDMPEQERQAVLRFARSHPFTNERFRFSQLTSWAELGRPHWSEEARATGSFVRSHESESQAVDLRELMFRMRVLSSDDKTIVLKLWASHVAAPGLITLEELKSLRRDLWHQQGVPAVNAAWGRLIELYGEERLAPLPAQGDGEHAYCDWVAPVAKSLGELQRAAEGAEGDEKSKAETRFRNAQLFVSQHHWAQATTRLFGFRS